MLTKLRILLSHWYLQQDSEMLLIFILIHAHKNEKEKGLYTKNRVRFVFRIQSNTKFSSQEVVYFMVQI